MSMSGRLFAFSLYTVSRINEFALMELKDGSQHLLLSKVFDQSENKISRFIDTLMADVMAQLKLASWDHKQDWLYLGVCPGPGSFTGIRLGISCALALTRAFQPNATLHSIFLSDLLLKDSHSVIAMDGHNGFFSLISQGDGVRHILNSELAKYWDKSWSKLFCSSKDYEKLKNLLDKSSLGSWENIDEQKISHLMCEKLFSPTPQMLFSGPKYGLEAFTNASKNTKTSIT